MSPVFSSSALAIMMSGFADMCKAARSPVEHDMSQRLLGYRVSYAALVKGRRPRLEVTFVNNLGLPVTRRLKKSFRSNRHAKTWFKANYDSIEFPAITFVDPHAL